jgi:hypothetical protein
MSSSLVKFMNRTVNGNGRGKVFWGRSEADGLPFRGPEAPMLTNEEYEDRLVRIHDPKNGIFDVTNEEENKRYLEIMDGLANGWYQLIYINRQFDEAKALVYVEWLESYMEDGSPSRPLPSFQNTGLGNGQ